MQGGGVEGAGRGGAGREKVWVECGLGVGVAECVDGWVRRGCRGGGRGGPETGQERECSGSGSGSGGRLELAVRQKA